MLKIVVGGIIEKDNKYLLIQEAKESVRGKWNIPAGKLEQNEYIIDGAKRKIKEETGCNVLLTGILQIGNKFINDDTMISFIFLTKLLDENISYNKDEILDIKWFTYEEIKNMKNELRQYEYIVKAIDNLINNKVVNMDLIHTI